MSFSNYTELQTTLRSWLFERTDLDEIIPDFITLAEAYFNRKLRGDRMIVRSRAVAAGQYISLPNDWRKAVNVQRVADGKPLGYMPYHELDKYRQKVQAGVITAPNGPEYYCLMGREIELAPAPTATDTHEIEMVYYASIPPLTDANQTNWLLTEFPDLYLYGALVHSAPYLQDDERTALWGEMLRGLVDEFNGEQEAAEISGAPLVMGQRTF